MQEAGGKTIKPHFWSFMLPRLVGFFVFFLIAGFSGFGLMLVDPFIGIGVMLGFFIVFALWFYAIYISYKKESYTFDDKKIVRNFGTIFSDNTLELQYQRVAIVSVVRPFYMRILFGTGHIVLKAAGSASSKFRLQYVKNPKQIYKQIEEYLQKGGFHIEKSKLVQEARPHMLGIFGEIGQKMLVTLFFGVYIFGGIVAELEGDFDIAGLGFLANIGIGVIAFIIILSFVVLSYLDLRKRRYYIYDDAVEFYEGFLTKRYSLIPMENVSDVENTQSFFSKIFGLHDIKVSCAGAGNDVMFKNMTHGETMIKNLKYLKDAIIPKEVEKRVDENSRSLVSYIDKVETPLKYDQDFTGEYKMNKMRAIVPYIVLLIPPFTPIGIAAIVSNFIGAYFTNYSVSNSSMDKRFHFLTNKHTSYSIEKITGIIFVRNLLDLAFGTCSVKLLSLGSSGDLSFKHLKYSPELEKNLREKVGIYLPEKEERIPIRFTFLTYLKANIGRTILFVLLAIVSVGSAWFLQILNEFGGTSEVFWVKILPYIFIILIVATFVPVFLYKKLFYSKKYYRNIAFDGGIYSQKGIFIRSTFYALERNIKGITSVKYPFTKTGKLQFNVAGEKFIQTQKKQVWWMQAAGTLVSNMIGINYVDVAQDAQKYFDQKFFGAGFSTELVTSSRQSVKNTLVLPLVIALPLVGVSVIADPIGGMIIAGIAALFLGGIIWTIKVKYYDLETSRVVAGSGIIYKKRQSILYSKFNFIELNRGFFNKMFRNGSIGVFTLGSGVREMQIQDIDPYDEFYELLQTQ